jgi:endonuclease YncB( thermonuclease family)
MKCAIIICCLLIASSGCRKSAVTQHPSNLESSAGSVSVENDNSPAYVLEGRVIAVNDGDTITVRDAQERVYRVRLIGIDAPERGQDFGGASRQGLAQLVTDKPCAVKYNKTDQFGRLLGRVFVDDNNVNVAQVRAGFAWHYRKERDIDARERLAFESAEASAKAERRGLWQQIEPTPPWDYRRSHKSEQQSPSF